MPIVLPCRFLHTPTPSWRTAVTFRHICLSTAFLHYIKSQKGKTTITYIGLFQINICVHIYVCIIQQDGNVYIPPIFPEYPACLESVTTQFLPVLCQAFQKLTFQSYIKYCFHYHCLPNENQQTNISIFLTEQAVQNLKAHNDFTNRIFSTLSKEE